MNIETLIVGPFEVNCFILHGTENRVLIVDPGDDAERILEILTAGKLSVCAYLLTHGHADHVSALTTLLQHHPAPTCIHPADAAWAFSAQNKIPPFYTMTQVPPTVTREIRDGSTWDDAGLQYTVFETPGHTPGCVCFYFSASRTLITGDTLFAGTAGRTDLPGGDAAMQKISLARLKTFSDDVSVYPGHGQSTTMGHEKKTNFFMR